MRSPNKPGYEPLTPATPTWVGDTSASAITAAANGATISGLHFENIDGNAIRIEGVDGLTIERCTFAHCWQGIYLYQCQNVTIRDCAFYEISAPSGSSIGRHAILVNDCDTVVVEDCFAINPRPTPDGNVVGDVVNFFATDNGTVRRCSIMGDGESVSAAGIIVGDAAAGGGDNLLVEDNVLIDATITACGTNNVVRRNVILNRGLVATVDGKSAGILVEYEGADPERPIGPTEVSNNVVRCYNSNGSLDTEVQPSTTVTVTGRSSNPVAPLIDEYSRWDLTGYYGWP